MFLHPVKRYPMKVKSNALTNVTGSFCCLRAESLSMQEKMKQIRIIVCMVVFFLTRRNMEGTSPWPGLKAVMCDEGRIHSPHMWQKDSQLWHQNRDALMCDRINQMWRVMRKRFTFLCAMRKGFTIAACNERMIHCWTCDKSIIVRYDRRRSHSCEVWQEKKLQLLGMAGKEITVVRYDKRRNHSCEVWQEKKLQLWGMTREESQLLGMTREEISCEVWQEKKSQLRGMT